MMVARTARAYIVSVSLPNRAGTLCTPPLAVKTSSRHFQTTAQTDSVMKSRQRDVPKSRQLPVAFRVHGGQTATLNT
jgi:hypothetical protein